MKITLKFVSSIFLVLLVSQSLSAAGPSSGLNATTHINPPTSTKALTPQTNANRVSGSSKNSQTGPVGDTYSLTPLVQDADFAYFMTGTGQATTHQFDEAWKTIGENEYGTPGSELMLIDKIETLENGDQQVSVQVTAVSSQNNAEPWVDASFSGTGLNSWRLDIATELGGTNPILPDTPFEVAGSGVVVFNSAGDQIGEFAIVDTSDANGLSGYFVINIDGETDIAGFDLATMIMYWNVRTEPVNPGPGITTGQSGAWFDPTHDGEGYFLQVLSETQAVVFWFTYDKNGNQFWMVGVGNIVGSKIIFPDLQSPHGGKFGPDFDPDDVEYPTWGTLELDFSSCDSGVATYAGPAEFGSGTLNLKRLTTLWGIDCDGNQSSPSTNGSGFLNVGFSGSWFDPSHNGEGFVVEILNETTALVIWFTYDRSGNPTWLLNTGVIDGATIIINNLEITSGGVFGPGFDPDKVVREPWGTAAFTFTSCGNGGSAGNMRYAPPPAFDPESNQFLNRLVSIHGIECEMLTETYNVQGTMSVSENIFLDGDVNNPDVPEVSNDLDADFAQQLASPAKLAGFATADSTGVDGDRFADSNDEWDVYVLPIQAGESISLNISDWQPNDSLAVDFDLYLANVNDPETTVDSSLGTDQTEWVTAPEDGDYFVLVNAFNGASNYLLRSGQSVPLGFEKLSGSAEMVTGELIAKLWPKSTAESSGGSDSFNSRVEAFEKNKALIRIKDGGKGEILYELNTARMDLLVPHPLTLIGRGSITPEDWAVIRTAKSLSVNRDFQWSGPNYSQHLMDEPNDPGYGFQWNYPMIKLPFAWDRTTGDLDVVVAVIDGGVAAHPDLSNVDYSLGFDFVVNLLNSVDGDGLDSNARDPGREFPLIDYSSHGTHVAGIVGATGNDGFGVSGVNWGVTIMPVRVCGALGCSCWDVKEGMKWAGRLSNASGSIPARKADVINMSLGGPAVCAGRQDIVNQLVNNGAVVIAAAGNDGTSIRNYPASLNNVVSVSATTITDELAPYSSYGSTIDIAAPGGDASTDWNNDNFPDGILSPTILVELGTNTPIVTHVISQGTSMASPHIAGVAALMKSVYPAMGSSEFFNAVSSGAITVDLANNGAGNKDSFFGYGRIDAQKAVNWAIERSQGSPTDAFLTSSISSANFGSNGMTIDFVIARSGTGSLSVSGGGDTETWMQVETISVDGDGLGTYRIRVDRSGLIDGTYSGWVGIDGSDGSRIWISVTLQVGNSVRGAAGYQYALLLDNWTLGNVKQWSGLAVDGDYLIRLNSNPPGRYFLLVGSDIDNDFTICDEGEFCQTYPINSQAIQIVVSNQHIQVGNFNMGFPSDSNSGNASSSTLDTNAQSNAGGPSDIRARIGSVGIARKK